MVYTKISHARHNWTSRLFQIIGKVALVSPKWKFTCRLFTQLWRKSSPFHGTFCILHEYWLVQVLRERTEEEVESSMTPELPVDEEPPSDGEIPDIAEISIGVEQYDDGWRDLSEWEYWCSEKLFANFDWRVDRIKIDRRINNRRRWISWSKITAQIVSES